MSETLHEPPPHAGAALPWSVGELEGLREALAAGLVPEAEATGCLAQIEALEALKSLLCAAQVRATRAFAVLETARLEEAAARARAEGRRAPVVTPAVGAQVGLARQESPARGRALTEAATALVTDLPHTLEALAAGVLNEERALLVVRETKDLSAADRRAVDVELALGPHATPDADPDALPPPQRDDDLTGGRGVGGMGIEALRRFVGRLALRHDPQAAARRAERARARRHVTGRLLSDGTGRITAVVKAEHYSRVMAALGQAAATARAAGDPRTSGQVRADALVQRVTGIDPTVPATVELHLVVPATSLLGRPGAPAEPGWILGGGYVPIGICRSLFTEAAEAGLAGVRRVFAEPRGGRLVAMETASRTFAGLLARMIRIRDADTCRTPWCDAPIRHVDHVVPVREGGARSYDNAQGLCETCNHVKEAPGWAHWPDPTGSTHITTPSGSTYTTRHTPLTC